MEVQKRIDDKDEEWKQRRLKPESTVTVSWIWVLGVFASIYAFFFWAVLNHENRITKQETSMAYISQNINDIKAMSRDNNELLRKHTERDKQ